MERMPALEYLARLLVAARQQLIELSSGVDRCERQRGGALHQLVDLAVPVERSFAGRKL